MDLIRHFGHARNVVAMPTGAVIFAEGDAPTHMYVLIEGEAAIAVGGDIVEEAQAPALFGEMALVDASPRSATVFARTPCRLVPIDNRQFDLLVRESPDF